MKKALAILAVAVLCSTFAFAQSAQNASVEVSCTPIAFFGSNSGDISTTAVAGNQDVTVGTLTWGVKGDASYATFPPYTSIVLGTDALAGVSWSISSEGSAWATQYVPGCNVTGTISATIEVDVDNNAMSGTHTITVTCTL